MPRINLLPWREERRLQRDKNFKMAVIGIVVLAALVLFAWYHTMSGKVEYQNNRNAYLKTTIQQLDKKIDKIKDLKQTRKELLARMKIIEKLQQSRPQIVHLFDQVVRTLPDGVYLTSVTQKGNTLHLKGIAQSSARISTYMRNIAESDWLADPNLTVIKAHSQDGHRRKSFSLTATITAPSEDKKS